MRVSMGASRFAKHSARNANFGPRGTARRTPYVTPSPLRHSRTRSQNDLSRHPLFRRLDRRALPRTSALLLLIHQVNHDRTRQLRVALAEQGRQPRRAVLLGSRRQPLPAGRDLLGRR